MQIYTHSVRINVCVSSTCWLVVVTAGCILSIQGSVVPHSFSVSATCWLVVLLQAEYFYGCGWILFLVVPLSVPWFYTVSHPSGNEALILCLWQVSVSKDISGSCGYGRTRGESWDSVWSTWISADHQLGTDYQSIDYWLLINDLWLGIDYQLVNCWLLINHQFTSCPLLTVILQPHTHSHTHHIHLVKATNICKFIQIKWFMQIH